MSHPRATSLFVLALVALPTTRTPGQELNLAENGVSKCSIVVNWGRYISAEEAPGSEEAVDWGDADASDDRVCTECFADAPFSVPDITVKQTAGANWVWVEGEDAYDFELPKRAGWSSSGDKAEGATTSFVVTRFIERRGTWPVGWAVPTKPLRRRWWAPPNLREPRHQIIAASAPGSTHRISQAVRSA